MVPVDFDSLPRVFLFVCLGNLWRECLPCVSLVLLGKKEVVVRIWIPLPSLLSNVSDVSWSRRGLVYHYFCLEIWHREWRTCHFNERRSTPLCPSMRSKRASAHTHTYMETPRGERTKWDEMRWNDMKWDEMTWNENAWFRVLGFWLHPVAIIGIIFAIGGHNSFVGMSGWSGQVSAQTLTVFIWWEPLASDPLFRVFFSLTHTQHKTPVNSFLTLTMALYNFHYIFHTIVHRIFVFPQPIFIARFIAGVIALFIALFVLFFILLFLLFARHFVMSCHVSCHVLHFEQLALLQRLNGETMWWAESQALASCQDSMGDRLLNIWRICQNYMHIICILLLLFQVLTSFEHIWT